MTRQAGALASGPDHPDGDESDQTISADRAKSFIDAVVAIAMTLLILPLMEAITGEPPGSSGAQWFAAHAMLLLGFAVSFVVIAMFWIEHHWLFARVHRVTTALLWLNVAWLAMIVWLPVATAMGDEFDSTDPLVVTVYIGSMATASILLLLQWIFLSNHPALHSFGTVRLARGVTSTLAMSALFLISLLIAVLFPDVGYLALFLLCLVPPLSRLFGRMRRPRDRHRKPRGVGRDQGDGPPTTEGAP